MQVTGWKRWMGVASAVALAASAASTLAAAPAGASATTTPVAAAPTASSRTAVRQHLENALSGRAKELARLTAAVASSTALSSAARQTLTAQLAAETAGIGGLASSVPGLPATQLHSAASTMVHEYRVSAVMAPKVHLALRAARQAALEQSTSTREASITRRIQAVAAKGGTVRSAQQAAQNLATAITQAAADTGQVDVATVLAVQPSGYPADGAAIAAARTSLRAARTQLLAARADGAAIRAALRAGS